MSSERRPVRSANVELSKGELGMPTRYVGRARWARNRLDGTLGAAPVTDGHHLEFLAIGTGDVRAEYSLVGVGSIRHLAPAHVGSVGPLHLSHEAHRARLRVPTAFHEDQPPTHRVDPCPHVFFGDRIPTV